MAKKESTLKNMLLALFVISFVSSGLLGVVYEATKEPIEMAKVQKEESAVRKVLPLEKGGNADAQIKKTVAYVHKKSGRLLAADSLKLFDSKELDSLMVYHVTADGAYYGAAVKTFTDKGFGGRIVLMAGFRADGSISGTEVLEHKETPGLGTEMSEPAFSEQFIGKNPSDYSLKVKKDGGQVDGITAATISSRAFCDAVQKGYDVWKGMDASSGASKSDEK